MSIQQSKTTVQRLYDAAANENENSSVDLLWEDLLVLERVLSGCAETPLHVSAIFWHIGFVREIVRRKPELANVVDSRGSLPLHLTAARGHIQIAKFHIFAYAEGCVHKDIDERNPIHIAVMNGHTDVIQEILQRRSDLTKLLTGSEGTILHLCTKFNQYESFKLLVQRVATGLNVLELKSSSSSFMSIQQSKTTVQRLYDAVANENGNSLVDLLREDFLVLERVLSGCVETPLHVSAIFWHIGFVREIVKRKSKLAELVDSRGSLPLHLAATRGHIQVAKFLIFAYVEGCVHKDIDGRNLIHIVAMNGYTNVIQEILQIRLVSAKILTGSEGTILHLYTKFNQYESFKLLVQRVATGLNREYF
ncbi:hypothetical protein EZV62_026621 [Acer yangbiense]|uniref:Uncharacterized protein n=1 Tax=Acer yangbiense TaxID=1000413 RepID=A0A5C7GS95_9ROSI|nr:hypothetical protein EZV62_026621 [Acer yangbiense]